jgi:hypothetical protein
MDWVKRWMFLRPIILNEHENLHRRLGVEKIKHKVFCLRLRNYLQLILLKTI